MVKFDRKFPIMVNNLGSFWIPSHNFSFLLLVRIDEALMSLANNYRIYRLHNGEVSFEQIVLILNDQGIEVYRKVTYQTLVQFSIVVHTDNSWNLSHVTKEFVQIINIWFVFA